jgi:hypothetical protein
MNCPVCNEPFPNFRALNGHQNKHRGPVQERKQERLERKKGAKNG